jgi:hypothetical protein
VGRVAEIGLVRHIMKPTLLLAVVIICGIPALLWLYWGVHCALDRLCVHYARRFCRRRGWNVSRVRWQPAFESSGVKTEFTLVQLDCLDSQVQRRLVLLSVWPFGVRTLLSDEPYPESDEERWPTQSA